MVAELTSEAMMDRQTKMAMIIVAVLIAFVVILMFYGSISGWYE
jgi:hypothetical protein